MFCCHWDACDLSLLWWSTPMSVCIESNCYTHKYVILNLVRYIAVGSFSSGMTLINGTSWLISTIHSGYFSAIVSKIFIILDHSSLLWLALSFLTVCDICCCCSTGHAVLSWAKRLHVTGGKINFTRFILFTVLYIHNWFHYMMPN